jgi:hypothetical protein
MLGHTPSSPNNPGIDAVDEMGVGLDKTSSSESLSVVVQIENNVERLVN